MEPGHHDRVLAIVSHLPHLIAFTICGTADDLEDESRQEVLQFAASGFRDFTRIASSDPVMWRDVFLNNREALLEMLARFMEDAQAMARAVRWGDAAYIEDKITPRAQNPPEPDRAEAGLRPGRIVSFGLWLGLKAHPAPSLYTLPYRGRLQSRARSRA